MQGFELNHDRLGMQAGLEILGVPTRRQSSYEAAPPAAASVFAGDGTLSLFNMKQSDPLQHSVMGFQLRLRDSRYWRPAQDLLREFCSLVEESNSAKKRPRKAVEPEEGKAKFLWCESMDLLELQKMRARLVLMLVEVDKRYARYAEHMRAAVEPFEAVAGAGAASDYSALASRAMSRHFRCLRDAIAGQTAAVRQAIADKGGLAAPTRGETPRLKLLDQCMRQRLALHQGLLEPHPWRPQRGLPERAVTLLRAWLFEHFLHPYPNDGDKLILARQTGLSRNQVSNWFINARVRLWKPMVEEMYMEEMKELDHHLSDQSATGQQDIGTPHNPNPSSYGLVFDDRKPLPPPPAAQLLDDSESVLSSIINSRNLFRADNYELLAGDLGFSCSNSSGGGGGSSRRAGASLTLGLQHHNGGGMSLSLLPKSHQHVNDDEDDEEQVLHFSILDGEAVSLPYRNLMGAQLLHDLAG